MKLLASFYSIKRDKEGETTLVLKIDASQSNLIAPLYCLDDMKLLVVEINEAENKNDENDENDGFCKRVDTSGFYPEYKV